MPPGSRCKAALFRWTSPSLSWRLTVPMSFPSDQNSLPQRYVIAASTRRNTSRAVRLVIPRKTPVGQFGGVACARKCTRFRSVPISRAMIS